MDSRQADSRPTRPGGSLLAALLALTLAIMACQVDLGGPASPCPPAVTSPEAEMELRRLWDTAMDLAAERGVFVVEVTETQLSSLLAGRLADEDTPVLKQARVCLRDDRIQIFGLTERGPFRATALVTIETIVEPEGDLRLEIAEVDLGPLPAPAALTEAISALLTEAFTGSIGSLATGIRIQAVAIGDGRMTLVGELR